MLSVAKGLKVVIKYCIFSTISLFFFFFSVIQPSPHTCLNHGHVQVPISTGYLSSTVTQETQCGSPTTPYLIRLPAGQRLNVTLIDFDMASHYGSIKSRGGSSSNSAVRPSLSPGEGARLHAGCIRYAAVHELLTGRSQNICGRGKRVTHEFLSDSNVVEIKIYRMSSDTNYFLLHYEGW